MKIAKLGRIIVLGMVVGLLDVGQALAEPVSLPATVPVGNADNPGDRTGFGSVPYKYRIAKHEVTMEQYAAFLNAAVKQRTAGYLSQMSRYGLVRVANGTEKDFVAKAGWEKKPAVLASWNDAVRFANWLTNGMGDGSTENGAYKFIDEWGEKTLKMPDHAALAAGSKVHWVLASENEWYKAAYYDPAKNGGAGGYWQYPAPGGNPPKANLGTTTMMDVGSFPESKSAYGTLDQGGNVWEWNETKAGGHCGVRGGSFWHNDGVHYMASGTRYCTNPPEFVYDNYGFRVVALGGKASK